MLLLVSSRIATWMSGLGGRAVVAAAAARNAPIISARARSFRVSFMDRPPACNVGLGKAGGCTRRVKSTDDRAVLSPPASLVPRLAAPLPGPRIHRRAVPPVGHRRRGDPDRFRRPALAGRGLR